MTALLDPRVLVAFLVQFIGGDYGFCDRCGGTCYDRQHDCSGLQCHGTNGTGLTRNLCTSSFVIASQCFALGLYMSVAQVEADDGPDIFYAFHGADGGRTDDGSRPNGASGHIVLVVRVRDINGHTIGFYTIEAMGHAYGIVRGTYYGRGWTGLSRIPGVADRPPAAAHQQAREDDMIIQLHHYDTDHGVPNRPCNSTVKGRDPVISISGDGKRLEARYGASIYGDQTLEKKGNDPVGARTLAVWSPANLGNAKIIGGPRMRPKDDEDAHENTFVVLLDNGETRRGRLS